MYTKSFHQVTRVIEHIAYQIIPIRLILETADMMVPLPRLYPSLSYDWASHAFIAPSHSSPLS